MGGISSRLTRQFYRFNAENRAHKFLARKEPRPAPKHEKTLHHINILEKEMPTLKEDLAKFDQNLHDRLKQVYVTSNVQPAENVFIKPAPLSHAVRRTSDFGFDESDTARPGHITLKHLIEMIMTYTKSDDVKIEDLAKKHKLKRGDADNILKYYHCFTLRLPRGKLDKVKFLNTVLFGNEKGEVLTSGQFIKRIEDQKGIRDESTRGIPPLNKDVKAWEEEERKKRALPSGTSQRLRLSENQTSETKQQKSSENKE